MLCNSYRSAATCFHPVFTHFALTDKVANLVSNSDLPLAWNGILNEQQLNFNRKFIGQKFDILLERNGKKDNQLVGKSPYMQAVHVISKDHKIGDIIKTHILDADKNSLEGNYE